MKNKFLSKSVPRGTRTIWRYLSALILFFALSIGQMWAADPDLAIGTDAQTSSSFLGEYSTQGITLSSSASYSSGAVQLGNTPSGSSAYNAHYFEVLSSDAEIEKVSFLISGNGSNKSIQAPVFAWEETATSNTADTYVLLDAVTVTANSYAAAKWFEYDLSGASVKCARIYRTTKNISSTDPAYTGSSTALGSGQTIKIYGVKVWLKPTTPTTNYTVTIDPNGGSYASTPDGWTYDDVADKYTKSIASGTSFSAPAGLNKGTDDLTWKDGSDNDVTFPVSITGDITFVAQWAPHAASSDATLSALSVAGSTLNETFDPATTAYTITLPFYGAMPVVGDVTATKNDPNAEDPEVSISSNVITIHCEAEDGTTKDYTITVTISPAPTASSSINIEQLVLDNGKTYDIVSALTTANIVTDGRNGLDSLNDGKTARNYPYLGLKFKKKDADIIKIVVPADNVLNVKFGNVGVALTTTVNGAAGAGVAKASSGSFHLDAVAYVREVVFRSSDAQTVTLQQVKIGADVDPITLPWLVTYDAGEHGTCATAKEVWKGTALALPAVTPESGWNFEGWNDDEDNPVSNPYTPTKNVTLTAQYTAQASPFDLTALTYQIGSAAAENVGYVDGTFTYNIELPYAPSYDVITVAPTLKEATSSLKGDEVLTVSSLPGAATFTVVASDASEQLYTVNFSKAPKDGVSIIKVATTGGTNKTVTGLYAGDGDVNLSSSKKMDNGKYIGFTLDGTTLQAGDQINVHTTTAANTEGSHIIFYDNMTDKNELYETGEIGGTGDNIFEINAAMIGATTAYVYRSNADAAHQWNGYVDFIEVTRAMNPVLTAITIDGRDGEIDALDDKHFSVTIPYEADLAALTVVPTIVRNAAHPTTPEAVISNEGAWILGDNTYRIMDKDGDYTDYTITLDRDVLKHTVSFNTHGGTAVASEEVVHGEYLAAAPAAPTKDENVFKFWSETEDGAEVDVTTVQINADKEFHAVWEAEPAGIKLFNGNVLNTTNFISAAATTIEISEVEYPCLVAFNSNRTSLAGAKQGDLVLYNATTDAAKIKFDLYNANGSAKKAYVWLVEEGDAAATQLDEIEIAGETRVKTTYYEFNGTKNRTVYLTSGAKADIKVLQAKVIESGSAIKQFGQAGYSLNLNKGRLATVADVAVPFEGATLTVSSEYSVLNSSNLATKSANSFTIASPTVMSVKRSGGKYYVYQDPEDKGTLYSSNAEIELNTTGTWYISSETSSSAASFTKIEFLAPKCEQPTVVDMENIGLCEGDAFTALTVSASVSDGGTLHYQWYKEAGATDEAVGTDAASYTPEADGQYYVVVTNQLADHSDNSKTSNTVTVEHFASAVITSAPMNQRAEAGNAVTLTVAATGKNVAYKWYTCDNEAGDNPVAIVPAETNASLNITVTAGMNQWYKVVVSSDCGSDVFATARVSEFQPTTPATVTESIVWDWTSSVWPASGEVQFTNKTDDGTDLSPEYELLADADAIVPNNAGFRSDMLYGKGQYVWRSGNKFFQGTAIKFTTTVAGAVRVYFRSTGENKHIQVKINGDLAGTYDAGNFRWSDYVVVPAGDVEIICLATDANKAYTRIQKIEFLGAIDSRTGYAARELGTVCYEDDAVIFGANTYALSGTNEHGYAVFDEIPSGEIEAGNPYLFESNGGEVLICKKVNANHADDEIPVNGMIGSFLGTTLIPGNGNYYYFSGRNIWRVNDFTVNIPVPAHRCYVDYDVLSASPAPLAPAPGRRRVVLGVNGENQAQGFENIENGDAPMKVMIDGTLYILRGEKVFDATGRLVK